MDKKELSRQIREKKRAMTEEQIVTASDRLGELFLNCPEYKAAKTIYGYLPYNQGAVNEQKTIDNQKYSCYNPVNR